MGHIKLAAPVTHVWFSHGVPNKMALILGVTQKKLETVIYFARYLVTKIIDDKKEATLAGIVTKKELAIKEIEVELAAKMHEVENTSQKEIAKLRKTEEKKDKLDFKIQKLENDSKKELAKIKSVYSQKATNLDIKV